MTGVVRPELAERVAAWIAADPDPEDRATLARLLADGDEAELDRRFAHPLEFGTAGLRGPEMAGPAGMNRLSVRRATQGVVAWLAATGADVERGVVVGRDARHGSERFNDEVVRVLLGAGVAVWEMPRPLPTPFVSYCVRALGAVAGVMITASHNPPADNGYKLYGPDASQIIPPHDAVVQDAARRAGPATLGERGDPRHHVIEAALLDAYREHLVARFAVAGGSDLGVAYTPPPAVTHIVLLDALIAGQWPVFWSAFNQLILPAITLSTGTIAIMVRMIRSSMLEVMHQDYVRTAHAKGVPPSRVYLVHVMKNALVPLITVFGLQLGYLLGGAVLVETVFSWPGVGSYVSSAILADDYAPVETFALLSAVFYSIINLLVDILNAAVDPRITYQ